jgi:hypothetical protein
VSQSRLGSLAEALCNTAIGFGISWAGNAAFFWWYDIPVKTGEMLSLTIFMTFLSIGRGYFIRRLWNSQFWKFIFRKNNG